MHPLKFYIWSRWPKRRDRYAAFCAEVKKTTGRSVSPNRLSQMITGAKNFTPDVAFDLSVTTGRVVSIEQLLFWGRQQIQAAS